MSRIDDVTAVTRDFFHELDIVEFTDEDIDLWSRNLAQAIADEVGLPTCDCPGSGHVYPCHDWSPEE